MKTSSFIEEPSLRIKITGQCNLSCFFCHEEGGMKGVSDILPDSNLSQALDKLLPIFKCSKINLTGGEPFMNKKLPEIVSIVSNHKNVSTVKITTNGTILQPKHIWEQLYYENGLSGVTFTINYSSKAAFAEHSSPSLTNRFDELLSNQLENINLAVSIGISVKVNIVCCHSQSNTEGIIELLKPHIKDKKLDVVLLNNVYSVEKSTKIIDSVLKAGQYRQVSQFIRLGTSNEVHGFVDLSGCNIFAKQFAQNRFNLLCEKCHNKDKCVEGFYGLRLERRGNKFYIRTCVYNMPHSIFLLEDFVSSDLLAMSQSVRKC